MCVFEGRGGERGGGGMRMRGMLCCGVLCCPAYCYHLSIDVIWRGGGRGKGERFLGGISNPGSSALEADALTTSSTRRYAMRHKIKRKHLLKNSCSLDIISLLAHGPGGTLETKVR